MLAINDGGMSVKDAATHFGVSTRWIRTLLKRFRIGGIEALHPHSKRPHTNPNQTPEKLRETILALRHQLLRDGLDAGAATIYDLLPEQTRPSTSTIFRILKTAGTIQPQPQKRPRSSWQRFQAPAPNSLWQSDVTHWPLADGTDTEIISWLDDHSRYLTHISVHPRITGHIVVNTFLEATETHGLPAATLTDNGLVYTLRYAGKLRLLGIGHAHNRQRIILLVNGPEAPRHQQSNRRNHWRLHHRPHQKLPTQKTERCPDTSTKKPER
ncbi:transposase InsO family protein [Pseudoglutamicibacter albus]|uniref:Transposase InsO family protein n=1 Tax=Pseudoglutamicibacter albus TaxID=98671 RepID=A0ABU1YZR3_9MICC|nr:DDE-type integrase/transposase/recombinase [Pseudoglutamicibacter albus]MDR7293853.1 transposase InsO family protein [Pseudoglutamicibacter albus]